MLQDLAPEIITELVQAYTYEHPREPGQMFTTLIFLSDKVGIPAGDVEKAKNILGNFVMTDSSISEPTKQHIKLTGLTLRDYQDLALIEALDYLDAGYTSFNLSGEPGSGKSVMLAALLAALNIKTLVIAHLSMLTEQLKNEISEATNANVVILNKDNLELGDVNIATSQFIAQRPELWYKIKKEIGLLVVDEAETIASETTLRILQRAHAKYRIAITATFTRSVDGRTPALKDMIGHKVITLKNDKLLKPTIITVNCDEYFKAPRNKNLYKRQLVKFFSAFESIDEKVIKITVSSLKKGRQVLIATDLNEFQNRYAEQLEALGYKVGVMNGKTSKDDRKRILEEYNEGVTQVLLGFGVLNAGLSIPKISTIIRVSTPGNLEKLEQLIGRGRRTFPEKEGFWFIDLMFRGFSYASDKRHAFYRKKKKEDSWTVSNTSWNKLEEKL